MTTLDEAYKKLVISNKSLEQVKGFFDAVSDRIPNGVQILGPKASIGKNGSKSAYIFTSQGTIRISDHNNGKISTVQYQTDKMSLLANIIVDNGKISGDSTGLTAQGMILDRNQTPKFNQSTMLASYLMQSKNLVNEHSSIFDKVKPKTVEELAQETKTNYDLAVQHGMPTLESAVKAAGNDLASFYKPILQSTKELIDKRLANWDSLTYAQKLDTKNQMQIANEIAQMIKEKAPEIVQTVKGHVVTAGEDAYNSTFYQIEQGHRVTLNFAQVDKKLLQTMADKPVAGKTLSQRLYHNTDEMADNITHIIGRNYVQGASYKKTAKDIQEEMKLHVNTQVQASYDKALRIATTEMGRMQSLSQQMSYEEAADCGVDSQKMWVETGVAKEPRQDHIDADGQTVDVDEEFTVGDVTMMEPRTSGDPEQDINCHCTTQAIISDFAPTVRTWPDGSQSDWQSYGDWLDGQSEDTQAMDDSED